MTGLAVLFVHRPATRHCAAALRQALAVRPDIDVPELDLF
jgi:hypothetical protein